MTQARHYTSGTDVSVYLTDDPRMPAGTPPRFDPKDELDVAGVTIVQEGNIMPLYDYANHLVKHFAYATRLVTGALEFNFNEDFVRRYRQGQKTIQNSTLWFVLSRIEWAPETRIVHDYLRADFVWEHPFSHQPAPHASESVPFSARSLRLVARHIAEVDIEQMALLWENEAGVYTQDGTDFFRRQTTVERARVVKVTDGDTIKVVLESTGAQIDVRLMSVDTPESSKDTKAFKQNKSNDAAWRWPPYAPTSFLGAEYGDGGASPSQGQLDKWGDYATDVVKALLPVDSLIDLITDPGASPTDDPQFDPFSGESPRYMYRISTDAVGDLGTFLIENGLATPWYASSVEFNPDSGTYTSRMALIQKKYKDARALAGTAEGKGVWHSFDVTAFDGNWTTKGDLTTALP